jgi:hypothetical protein
MEISTNTAEKSLPRKGMTGIQEICLMSRDDV